MPAFTLHLADADATANLGALLGRSLPPGSVILLAGNLGSGKTTLVQGLGRELGIIDAIASPTFTLINEYSEGRLPLYHLDLYRLASAEVQALNLESYWEGQERPLGIVAIEWAERLAIRPDAYLEIHLTMTANDQRQADITAIGAAADWLEAIATRKT